MRLFYRLLILIVALLGLCLAVVLYYVANPKLPGWTPAQQVHYLEQWSANDRQTYYFTPQGTQVKGLRYDWFTALELPFSQQRFAAPEYLARFGFLIDPDQKATPNNPGNLPVGFARHQNPGSPDQFLDITCAACHIGELRFNGRRCASTEARPSMFCPPACQRCAVEVLAPGPSGQPCRDLLQPMETQAVSNYRDARNTEQ